MKKSIHKYLLLAYALISSVLIGGFVGFLIINPLLKIILDSFGYNSSQWVNYLVYSMVALSIGVCTYINKRRYVKHLRKIEL
jgi:ABC-type antimicrobial peptide transport system permease subunit